MNTEKDKFEEMFDRLPSNIKETEVLRHNSKKVLAALLELLLHSAAKESRVIYCSNAMLRKLSGMNSNELLQSIEQLVDYDLITRKKGKTWKKGEKKEASEYTVNLKKLKEPLIEKTFDDLFDEFFDNNETSETPINTTTTITTTTPISTSISTSTSTATSTSTETATSKANTIIKTKNKEKKVETAKDFKLNFDDILFSEEDSINESFVSIENDIDQQTNNTSSNEVVINEQVEEGASMGIEASESPVTNNTSSNEELYEQVMAKIKLSIDGFREFNTENDLKAHSSYTKKMLEFYSKGNKTVSDKAMEYLSTEYCKNLERIKCISRHQYVAGQGFKTLK